MGSGGPTFRGAVSDAEAAALVSDLVAIPSVNPLHESRLDPPFGEARVARYVADFGRSLGLTVQYQAVLPGRDNVLLVLEGAEPRRRLLFECHMDTVPGWRDGFDPFEPRVFDGRVYGRGACDVKGTLASMLLALRLLVRQGRRLPRTIVLAATVDEEHQARGVQCLSSEGAFAEAAVVGEPTELAIVIAHKGCLRWKLTTRGRAAHSSKAGLGLNAIDEMVDLLAALRAELGPSLASRSHSLVGSPTWSVCTIHGGVAVNVIPDACEVEIDRRTIPGETLEGAQHEMTETLQRILSRYPGLQAELGEPFVSDPALNTPEDAEIVRQLRLASEQIIDASSVRGVDFGTDASALSQAGIPSVVFGPGSIDVAHTAAESVSAWDVARAAEILATLSTLPTDGS